MTSLKKERQINHFSTSSFFFFFFFFKFLSRLDGELSALLTLFLLELTTQVFPEKKIEGCLTN
jgi:hypothetical protein